MSEEWRAIPGWEGLYEVSDQGRVRSLDREVVFRDGRTRHYDGRVLSDCPHPDGYTRHYLYRGDRRVTMYVHRAVALAFLGPSPSPERMYVCHRDGDPQNNRVGNLYWGTQTENMEDARRHGTLGKGLRLTTHCKAGHPRTPENTWTSPTNGVRQCRPCNALRDAKRRARKKASA